MRRKAALIAVVTLFATLLTVENLHNSPSTAPIGLPAPTPAFWSEVDVALLLYIICVAFRAPTSNILRKRLPRLTGFFQRKVRVPPAARIAALVVALIGG